MNSLRKSKYVSSKNSLFHVNLPPEEYQEVSVYCVEGEVCDNLSPSSMHD